jgi:pilus assembly protein Flp/PilA
VNISAYYDYFRARFTSEEGATATEYIVLLVFIAIAIIAGATLFGGALNGLFRDSATAIETGLTP